MNKNAVFLVIALMITVSLSGCLGRGGGNGENDKNMGSPEEVNAEDYNVLYIGHSFGRVFAETLQDYAHTAGFTDHAQYIEMSGGASGAPDALWEDDGHRENIKAYLDTGQIDVLIMICCSVEFVETGAQSDEAIWNFTDYALDKNPDTRIGLSMLWKDFPGQYENASDYKNGSELLHDSWVRLASNLSGDYPGADIFTFNHGAVAYELWDLFEAGQLEDDLDQLTGRKATSVFIDEKGHAGQIMIDTGTLIWLHAVHGIEPLNMPEFTQWNTDIRVIADSLLNEENQEGCTDSNATNYDENATVDDGSCAYLPPPEPPADDDDTPTDDDDNEDSGDIESETPEKSGFLGKISMMNIVLVFSLVLLLSLLVLFKIGYNRR